jgi:phosphatidylinositol-3-phosphatase
VAELIAAVSAPPGRAAPDAGEPAAKGEPAANAPADAQEAPTRGWTGGLPPLAPSAIAVAVMSWLAFGVGVGYAVSPGEGTGVSESVLVAQAPPRIPAKSPVPSTASTSQAAEAPAANTAPESTTPAEAASTPAAPAAPARKPSKGPKPKPGASVRTPTPPALPPIRHVFLIVLSDQGVDAAFGARSTAPYLSSTLTKQGELLRDYYAVSAGELANAIALISGQGPTVQTVANCPVFSEITPGTTGAEGQLLGSGCVYPPQTRTLADQLTSAGKTWRAYVESIESAGPGQPTSCRHPALGSADTEQAPSPGDPYVTWRNPFVYFDSIIDNPACSHSDVGLQQLVADLASASKTPSFAYIAPDRCHDGSEEACAPGQASGLAPAGAFLEEVVPEIERSPAYEQGGLIAITFDRAPQTGPEADSSGCCLTAPYQNLPAPPTPTASTTTTPTTTTTTTPTITATTPPAPGSAAAQTASPGGGGKVGLLLISKYVKPGSVDAVGEYNHFSLLASIEALFGLKPLGYAAAPGLLQFDKSVFSCHSTCS